MDVRERVEDPEEALRVAFDGLQARLWTAMPGQIVSYDATKQTVVVQPTIQGVFTATDGAETLVDPPLLPDVPVIFPRGGGCTLTFPIAAGDECLLVFGARGIDWWWQSGGVQRPAETRMHDLSDGFALVGPRSQAQLIGSVSTTAVELRSDDAATKISLDPSAQTLRLTAPGGIWLNGVKWDTHAHGGVQFGGSNTLGPH